jgi:archaemetzincin
MDKKHPNGLSTVLAATAVFGAACFGGGGDDSGPKGMSAADVIGQSIDNFRNVRSFQTSVNTKTQAEGLDVTSTGTAGTEGGALVYAQLSIDSGQEDPAFSELLFAAPDLYMRQTNGQWFVLSPWNQGQRPDELSDFSPEDLVVDYEDIAGDITGVEERGEETIDGEAFLHYAGDVDFNTAYPDAPEIADGEVHADLFLRESDYLPRRVRVVTIFELGEAKLVEDATFDYRDYNQPLTPPERPAQVSPWRDLEFPEAACIGENFERCLGAQTSIAATGACDGTDRRICLVPLGQVSPPLVEHLAAHYRAEYGLSVSVLTPIAVPGDLADPLREQIDAATLIDYMGSFFPEAHSDPNAVLIGVTPLDLYDSTSHFRYLFGVKGNVNDPKAVVSSFRMAPETYGDSPDQELFYSRFRKLVTKYIGLLYYGLPPSEDPASPMFDSVLGPEDLDAMTEPLPVQ